MRKSWVLVALLVLPGFAQAQPNAQPPHADAGAPSGAPALPPPPVVDDPMLAPVPPPKRVLASWSQAVEYLRNRSTDLKIALDQVLQAEAQTRIALAQYLPWINANNAGGGAYTHQLITRSVGGSGVGISSNGIVQTSQVPIPNTFAGSLVVQQNLLNAQEFDQISINELSEDATRLS